MEFELQNIEIGAITVVQIIIPLLIVVIVAPIAFFLIRKTRIELEKLKQERDEMHAQLLELEEQLESTHHKLLETREQLQQKINQLTNMRNILESEQKQPQNSADRELNLTRARLTETREQLEKILGGDLLINKPWLKLAIACVDLFDDLDKKSTGFDRSRQELALYVCSSLELILERSGVDVITDETVFDETRHLAEPARSRVASGAEIAETLSSGFVVGPRILRRAHVRLM